MANDANNDEEHSDDEDDGDDDEDHGDEDNDWLYYVFIE